MRTGLRIILLRKPHSLFHLTPGLLARAAEGDAGPLEGQSRLLGFDTDSDGMPDEWEGLNGLDPHNAGDALTYTVDTKGWYTNLEVYMNALVEHIMQGGNASADQTVDEYYPECVGPLTGIAAHGISSAILATDFYNLEGQRLDTPRKGVMIRVEHLSDGRHVATKVIK